MYIKKTITLPKELEKDVEKYLIGRHYSNLSEVIRDGIRRIVNYSRALALSVPLHRPSIEKSLTGVNSRSSYGTV